VLGLLEEKERKGRGLVSVFFFRSRRWREKKKREATVLVRLPSLLVFGREGAGKGCWFEGKRKMLEPAGEGEKDDEFSGLSLARQKREGMALV